MNARDDEDDPGHDSEQGNLEGAGNNMPHHQPKKPHTFRWRQRDIPIPEDAFHMKREEIIEPNTGHSISNQQHSIHLDTHSLRIG